MLRAGIVGLPNVGKSTLFNALTKTRKAEAANYPFCTIEPNVGIVDGARRAARAAREDREDGRDDPRDVRVRRHRGPREGREQGRGPRQQVPVAHPRGGRHRPGRPLLRGQGHRPRLRDARPVADIETITTELVLADLESVGEAEGAPREARARRQQGRDGAARRRREAASRTSTPASPRSRSTSTGGARGRRARLLPPHDEADALRLQRGRGRPRERRRPPAREEGARTGRRRTTARRPSRSPRRSRPSSPSSRAADAKEYLASLGVEESGVGTLIRAAYHLLGLRTYFTAGEKEVRAWTIHAGDTAPQAAGVIHTDFEKRLHQGRDGRLRRPREGRLDGGRPRGGRRCARRAGNTSSKDGDVLLFKFNVCTRTAASSPPSGRPCGARTGLHGGARRPRRRPPRGPDGARDGARVGLRRRGRLLGRRSSAPRPSRRSA